MALGNHCHLVHLPMSLIILVRQEQSLIFINIYMSDSDNFDKIMHKCIYYLLSIFALNFLSMHFFCLFFLSSVHALTYPPPPPPPLSKLQLDSIYGMEYSCTRDIKDSIYITTVCIYTVCIYILYGAGTEHKTHLLRLQ